MTRLSSRASQSRMTLTPRHDATADHPSTQMVPTTHSVARLKRLIQPQNKRVLNQSANL
jgi:hypothetical protein